MKKALVSGSNGFIGQHLCHQLSETGYEVISIPRDTLYERWELTRLIKTVEPDYIFHLASYGNHSNQPVSSFEDQDRVVGANITALTNLLQASLDSQSTLINVSTSSVTLDRQTLYSATKAAGEHLCTFYAQEFDRSIITVRPYSVYGPAEAGFRFIPTVIRSALEGKSFPLALSPRHDWIYVGDFTRALTMFARLGQDFRGQAVSIGTGKSYSNRDIVYILEQIHGKKIDYTVAESSRVFDTTDWECSPSDMQILESIGWQQQYNIERGLRETYQFYTQTNLRD